MRCLTALLIIYLFVSVSAFADDEPFTGPANWGGTGLMEIPTARVIRENSYRIGISQISPYRYYYGVVSPFKGVEIDGGITEILGVEAFSGSQYGNYKDKVLGFKLQLIPEGKYMPAIALGIRDPHGTRLYSSQYLVVSKQIYPFDFTLGVGNGRFGKQPLPSQGEGIRIEMLQDTKQWLKDSQFFWGIQFAPSEEYALMLEYSPIQYHKQVNDPAQPKYFKEPVPSDLNFGFRWKPLKWAEIAVSYQRGDKMGVNLSMNFDIGRPIVPIFDIPYKEKPEDALTPIQERIAKALFISGFSDIGIVIQGSDLWIEAQNDKYYYSTKAVGVILRIISQTVPETIERVNIILKENGVPLFRLVTTRTDVIDMRSDKLTVNEFVYISKIDTGFSDTLDTPIKHKRLFKYGIKPSFQTFLNDPSGFFKYRLGLSAWTSYHPWRGASFIAGLEGYPFNTISSANEPLSIPVRSDVVLYKREKVALGRLMFDQIYKTSHEIYGRIAGGLLEVQYAGIDGEIAAPLFDGRLLIGFSGSAVKKREPNSLLQLKSNDVKDIYATAFFNTRLYIPQKEFSVDIKTGRFLAGDKGLRVTLSKFINGVVLSAWYSITDTSMFSDSFNRGYHDKGIAITIPMRLFKGTDSKTAYSYALSPWTRDVAQDIDHYNNLFDFIGRNTKIFLDKDKKMMY